MTKWRSGSYVPQIDFMVIASVVANKEVKIAYYYGRKVNTVLIYLIIGFYLLHTKSSNGFRQWAAFQHGSKWASRRIVVCSCCSRTAPQSLRIGHLGPKLGLIGSKKIKIEGLGKEFSSNSLMCACDLCVQLVPQSVLASCLLWLIRLSLKALKSNMRKVFPRILFSCLRNALSLLHW